jgi:octaprenyl-diphosphate synthase
LPTARGWELENDLEAVELSLAGVAADHGSRIEEAARTCLSAGGKRLRPLLTCIVLRALGHDPCEHIDLVAAVELAHAGSLLHDDVIDGAQTRRGRQAVHLVFDVSTAILAGDLLLTQAVGRAASQGSSQLQTALATAVTDLCSGASLEHERLFDLAVDVAHARRVNRLKTASLFAYAAQAGALISGAGLPIQAAARSYGTALGEAFQTTDDLLDVWGDPELMGKPIGQDLMAGEITVPTAVALERDPELGHDVAALWRAGADGERLLPQLRARMERAGALSATRSMAAADAAQAVAALTELPASPWRDRLEALAETVVVRER